MIVLWLAGVCSGMVLLWNYNHAAGAPATPPALWPGQSSIRLAKDQYTLIMLAHPRCPCTRATLEELSKLMAYSRGRLKVYLLLVNPKDHPESWSKSDLWFAAARIPSVTVMIDEDGTEANRFGAATSGQAILYDPSGTLRFSGGITQARGHPGDNAGRSTIESLIDRTTAERDQTPVFGCPLFSSDIECRGNNHATPGN